MIQNICKIVIFISFALLLLVACVSTKERIRGKIVNQDDQIYIISSSRDLGVWNTKELSINYSYALLPDQFNLKGFISISEIITYTYSKIKYLDILVSFLDSNGKVVSSSYINPLYSVLSNPPRKIEFNSNLSIPAEAKAFCFSYSGEFQGDFRFGDSLFINHNPFH